MKEYTSWIVVIVITALIIGGIVWYSSIPGKYDDLALCVEEKGARFFGAFWCPYCNEQKSLFGKSATKLPYVECSLSSGNGQTQVCIDENIESYPTWEFADGTRRTGLIPLQELATITSCPFIEEGV